MEHVLLTMSSKCWDFSPEPAASVGLRSRSCGYEDSGGCWTGTMKELSLINIPSHNYVSTLQFESDTREKYIVDRCVFEDKQSLLM